MRVTLNLATRPFVELRPLYMRLRIAIAALALLAIVLGFAWRAFDVKARTAEGRMAVLLSQTAKFQRERSTNEARMREPQNAAELARSQFLNALFVQKGFSWTAVMMDLENVLPAGVEVTSIDPQITPDHQVLIRLRVSGERDRAVQLVKNLETSKRFVSPRLSSESLENQGTGQANGAARPGAFQQAGMQQASPTAVEFDIISNYNPLPEKSGQKGIGKHGTGSGSVVKGSARSGKGTPPGGLPPRRATRKPRAGTPAGNQADQQLIQNESVLAAQRIAAERARQAAQVPQKTGGPR